MCYIFKYGTRTIAINQSRKDIKLARSKVFEVLKDSYGLIHMDDLELIAISEE